MNALKDTEKEREELREKLDEIEHEKEEIRNILFFYSSNLLPLLV